MIDEKYKDMYDMPYVKSKLRSHMSIQDRAAQFSAFAALTGYEDAIDKKKEEAIEAYNHEYE